MAQGVDLSTQITMTMAALIKSAGNDFVCRYLGTGDPSKVLLSGEPSIIHSAGLYLILIWEGNPTYASYFSYQRGVQDAENAVNAARALGVPAGKAIYFTVDYDAQPGDMSAIRDYVNGLKSAIAEYKVGIYGGYSVIAYVHDSAPVPYYWQTYAWSYGARASYAQLYQYQDDTYISSISVDLDSESGDPGWWGPASTAPTGTGPSSDTTAAFLLASLLSATVWYIYWQKHIRT